MLLLSEKLGKKYSFIALPGWHCFGGTRGATDTPSGENERDLKERLASSADLHGLLSAHSITVFIAKASKGMLWVSCLSSQVTTWLTLHVAVYLGFGGLQLKAPLSTLLTMGCCPME